MLKEGSTTKTGNIRKRIVGPKEQFSYDTRRVFTGKGATKHHEYYKLKFCAFIDMFSAVYEKEKTRAEIFDMITNVLTKKSKSHSKSFNKGISKL
jgi:hypothetical protein